MEVTGESGGGMVKVTMNGKHEVKRVQIEPQVAAEDREMLEDLVAAAINDAVNKVEAAIAGAHVEPDVRRCAAAGIQAAVLRILRCSTPRRSPSSSMRCAPCRASGPRPRSAWRSICCRADAAARARSPRR